MYTVAISHATGAALLLDKTAMEARMKKNKEYLEKNTGALASAIAEGHAMVYGLEFNSGIELAQMLNEVISFSVAALMEQNKLRKTLPGGKIEKEDDRPGNYL